MSAPTHTLLYLQAVVSADGQAAFLPCEVVHTAPESGSPSTGAYTFALHDAAGKLLDSRHVDPGIRCGPKEKAAHILSTHLRLRAEAHSATLSRAGKRLAVLALQKKPPQVAFAKTPAKGTVVKGRQTIAWKSTTSDGSAASHSLWHSQDAGKTWLPLTLGVSGSSAEIDFDRFPPSDNVLLRVTATSGAVVAEAKSQSFKVKTRAVHVRLDGLVPGATLEPGECLSVTAAAFDWKSGPVTNPASYRWSSDLDGALGIGLHRNLILRGLGTHTITVTVTARSKAQASATAHVTVRRSVNAFIHTATAKNTAANYTKLSDKLLDGNPTVILNVTSNWNPPGSKGVYNPHPIGVWYDGASWNVFNQDLEPMPVGTSFNIDILDPGPTAFVHVGHPTDNSTLLSHPFANGDPAVLLQATANWNPNRTAGIYEPAPTGVWYDSKQKRWAVYNQNKSPMPVGAAFNIEVMRAGDLAWTHTARKEDTTGNFTRLDHPSLNGRSDVLAQVTPNWNPPGSRGRYNQHPIGVLFETATEQWAIFNQDMAQMKLGCAFNVSVP